LDQGNGGDSEGLAAEGFAALQDDADAAGFDFSFDFHGCSPD